MQPIIRSIIVVVSDTNVAAFYGLLDSKIKFLDFSQLLWFNFMLAFAIRERSCVKGEYLQRTEVGGGEGTLFKVVS